MVEVKLEHEKPVSVMAIVADIRDNGYVQGIDFDFSYYPSEFLQIGAIKPRHTIFYFYNENIASWFALKYCDHKTGA